MSANQRGGLKAAFSNFKRPDGDKEAELKLLGRTAETPAAPVAAPQAAASPVSQAEGEAGSYQEATSLVAGTGLTPRPLLHREIIRQLSFRCPVTLAAELRKKAAFNQLEQQQIIIEGIRRVLADLHEPPAGWEG